MAALPTLREPTRTFDVHSVDSLPLLYRAANFIPDALLITTARLEPPGPQIIYVNRAFTELTGYSADEVVGRSPTILQGEATSKESLRRLERGLGRGEEFDDKLVAYRKDGKEEKTFFTASDDDSLGLPIS